MPIITRIDMNRTTATALFTAIAAIPIAAQDTGIEPLIEDILWEYKPGTTAFAHPRVDSLSINDKKHYIDVYLTESAAYLPLSAEQLAEAKQRISDGLPSDYKGYKVKLNTGTNTLDELVLFAKKAYVRPTEKTPLVTRLDREAPTKGLDGAHIAMWQSHGLYYNGKGEWTWQRPVLYRTCEDMFTQSFVMPYLMPMLENAGAYVMSPRERGTSQSEYIIDNDATADKRYKGSEYKETNGKEAWEKTDKPGYAYSNEPLGDYENPFTKGTARKVKAVRSAKDASVASWNHTGVGSGLTPVYVAYQSLPNSATDVIYTVNASNGPHRFKVNQRMGGGTWIYLGHFDFTDQYDLPKVEVSNVSADKDAVVTADAVKIGAGWGNVARGSVEPDAQGYTYEPKVSGYPRYAEGARYWLQTAGAPDSVYSPTKYTNDYTDDYRSRGEWVNWLAGGSSVLPQSEGLGIPVDLALAFHSDAGITPGDSIIGTLGIYCTDNTDKFANGTSRLASRDLTDLVLTNITRDIRSTYEPNWTRRGMWNSRYYEARVPQVPTMLLELLSHQNFADMRYGLDPGFRFVVSRAIYKAMLQLLAHRDGRPYIVQPLPVRAFAISGGAQGQYRLSWAERVDTLESTATPTYYIIEHRGAQDKAFKPLAKVAQPYYDLSVGDEEIHSYRIIAGNDGGVSFPSEILSLRYKPDMPQVTIVNAFTRVSSPETFDYGEVAGFNEVSDVNMPYMEDISYVGPQYEFRRTTPWMSNEQCGFGASQNYALSDPQCGNNFDYTTYHGEGIAKAGYGFVSISVEAFADSKEPAQVVDVILGMQKEMKIGSGAYGTKFKTFTPELQRRLEALSKQGTGIFVSGAYIGSDLWCNPFSSAEVAKADQEFAKNVLGYTWRTSRVDYSNLMDGVQNPFKLLEDERYFIDTEYETKFYDVNASNGLGVADSEKAAAIMRYDIDHQASMVAFESPTHRAIALGVPYEKLSYVNGTPFWEEVLGFLTKKTH